MPIQITAEQEVFIGQATVIQCPAPSGVFGVVFEDDEETGYFYGLDTTHEGMPIQDAAWLDDVEQATDRAKPVKVRIGWSLDHKKVILFINDSPCAVFDFMSKHGYSRTGFPPPAAESAWSRKGHQWFDGVLDLFE